MKLYRELKNAKTANYISSVDALRLITVGIEASVSSPCREVAVVRAASPHYTTCNPPSAKTHVSVVNIRNPGIQQ